MDQPFDVLIVSQMYPGPSNPDLGVFVEQGEHELRRRNHPVRVVAVTRRGGGIGKHLSFAVRTIWAIIRRRPDVVWAHFLVPAGFWAALACMIVRRPFIVTAHGRDVRNVGRRGAVRWMTKLVVRRAAHVVVVSEFLRRDLADRLPLTRCSVHVIDAGTDTTGRFVPRDQQAARDEIAWPWADLSFGTAYLFVGTLDDRKNVLRLATAFERVGSGTLTFVGDGPLRADLEGRERIRVVGRVAHEQVATWIAAADVLCLPSLVEPFGQVAIEAMACARSVMATEVGGPPEFVGEGCGILVDPLDITNIEQGMRIAGALPVPNQAARQAACKHDIAEQTGRVEHLLRTAISGSQPQRS